MVRRRACVLWASGLAACVVSGAALAQGAGGNGITREGTTGQSAATGLPNVTAAPSPKPIEIVTAPTRTALGPAAARAVARVAMLDLRLQDDPTDDDYRVTALLLDLAQRWSPTDTDILRRRIEAHFNSGDDRAVLTLTRELVRLDPRDTVAQLRLISARVADLQTAERRLAAYARFLGPEGASFDASVRSRLALDAALLARELGDEDRFLNLLEEAARLDSSNKAAALLAFTVFAGSVDSATGRLELLANLLYSDPLDPRVHQQIRDELAAGGAFEQARRFNEIAATILKAAGSTEDSSRDVVASTLAWHIGGPGVPLRVMTNNLLVDRDRADRQAKAQEAATGIVTVKRGSEVRLSMPLEVVRLASSLAAGDTAQLEGSIADLAASIADREASYNDATRRPINVDPAELSAEIASLRAELVRWQLLANVKPQEALLGLEAALATTAPGSVDRASLLALGALRAGDTVQALEVCDLSPRPSPWLELTRGLAHRLNGDEDQARVAFVRAFELAPLGLLGALGHSFASAIPLPDGTIAPAHDPKLAAALTEYARTIPSWIDRMPTEPASFQSLRVWSDAGGGTSGGASGGAGPLDPLMVTLRLTNTAPIPLGVGSDRTINARLLCAPNLDTRRGNARALADPEVIETSQRLRLMPGESFDMTSSLDAGPAALVAELNSHGAQRVWWRVLQGFESRPGGVRETGAGSLDAISTTFTRPALPESTRTTEFLIERIRASGAGGASSEGAGAEAAGVAVSGDELPALIVAARNHLFRTYLSEAEEPGDAISRGQREALCAAIVGAFASWPVEARVMAVASLPSGRRVPELSGLDALALDDADAAVRAIALVTRADARVLEQRAADADALVAEVAAAHARRLASGSRAFVDDGFARQFPAVDAPAGAGGPAPRGP